MSTTATATAPRPAAGRDALAADARTISLVGLAHGTSHFFHMLLPPMFPVFAATMGLSFAQLGLLVTVFFTISGPGQALAGFLVDRVGARPVLMVALACFAAAAVVAGTASGYGGLMAAAALAGLGNAPFHPIDFTILNRRISPTRLGHAYSVHGITGNLGWGAAPLVLVGVASATGSWRWSYAVVAAWAMFVLTLLAWQRHWIDDRDPAAAGPGSRRSVGTSAATDANGSTATGPEAARAHPLAFLRLPSIWLCLLFFFWTSASLAAIQGFASPGLTQLYGLPLHQTAFVVSAYMGCGMVGMVIGGFLAGRIAQLERIIGAALLVSAGLLALVAAQALPGPAAAVAAALAGFGTGLAGPSRDMLIRRATPPGATGRVYGTVYSGLDLGLAVAAPVYGWLMDHQRPAGVFAGAAIALVLAVASAGLVARGLGARAGVATRRTGP